MKGTVGISALILAVVSFRLLAYQAQSFSNFAPILALALCSGWMTAPLARKALAAFGGLILADLFINARTRMEFPEISLFDVFLGPAALVRYGLYAGFFALACYFGGRARLGWVVPASVGAALLFHGVTNTAAWMFDPGYAKTTAGWWQSQWMGLPGYPPSYWFLRNLLIGNVAFSLVFYLLVAGLPQGRSRHAKPISAG